MMDKKDCEKCACFHGGLLMDCCMEHKMSKEHLEHKKKMLEEKLKWVEEELAKK